MITAAAAFLVLAAVVSATATISQSRQLMVLPLIPHSVQKHRFLLQQKQQQAQQQPLEERPTRSKYNRITTTSTASTTTPVQMAALYQGYGTHYVDLWVGTPEPQRQTVIVDTGSGVTAFPCQECTHNCGVGSAKSQQYHIDGLFQQSQSLTFQKVKCDECLRGHCVSQHDDECIIHMSYAEGSSWTAYESKDQCYVGGLHSQSVSLPPSSNNDDLNPFQAANFAFDLQFGCQTSITGLFITQLADGIMGMDRANSAFYEQIYQAQKVPNRAFALCFWRQTMEVSRDGTQAGALTLGGTDTRLHTTPMLRTPLLSSQGFYSVHIRNMFLSSNNNNDNSSSSSNVIPIPNAPSLLTRGEVIVDSGTTDTYLARSLEPYFKQVFQDMVGETYSHKGISGYTAQQLDEKYPTILFQIAGNEEYNRQVETTWKKKNKNTPLPNLAGDLDPQHPYDVILAMPPSHYFEYDTEKEVWVARFYLEEASGGVLGANAMMGHDVLFDVDSVELGWAESLCDYASLLEEYDESGNTNDDPPSRVDPSKDEDESGSADDIVPFPSGSTGTNNATSSIPMLYVGLIVAVSMSVLYVGLQLFQRSRKTSMYEIGELELQTIDEEEFQVQYRDDVAADEGVGYDDEESNTANGTMA